MTDIDPKIIQRLREQLPDSDLQQASEWSYSCKDGPHSRHVISRFMVEKGLTIRAADIQIRWPLWNHGQRLDFAANWLAKPDWTDEDTQILEIIMADGDDQIWESCAQAFSRHPDRERIVRFLVDRVRDYSLSDEPLNYFQVLGMCQDTRAVAAMRPFYEKYKKAVDAEISIGVPEDVFFGPIPYHAFLSTAGSLFKITGSSEYEEAIRNFFGHEHKQVRYWAERALNVEGPTAANLHAEYKQTNPS